MKTLRTQYGVDSRPFFSRLSSIPAYAYLASGTKSPSAELISGQGLNIPSALMLDEEDIQRVSDALLAIVASLRLSP